MIMSDEIKETELQYVEIYDEDGNVIKCEIYDIVDFDEKTYALLLPLTEDENDEDSEVIVMQYVEEGDEGYFQNIDNDEEFKRVCEYIESLSEEEGE